MIKDLLKLSKLCGEITLLCFYYDFHFDGNEIIFGYSIHEGFKEPKIIKRKNFNACNYHTNRAYFYKELLEIRKYFKSKIEE